MSDVPRETPTPTPTAMVFEVPGQDVVSFAEAHIVFEAAAVVTTVLVIGRPVLPLDTTTVSSFPLRRRRLWLVTLVAKWSSTEPLCYYSSL